MTDAELVLRLDLPEAPRTGGDLIRHIAARSDWRVDRILGSAGDIVIEVTFLPLDCHSCIVCRRRGDTYTVQSVCGEYAREPELVGAGAV